MKAYSDFVNEHLNKNKNDTQVVEVVEDHLMKEAKKALPPFLKALENLSKMYGIYFDSSDGISYERPSMIKDVKYSGDLKNGKVGVDLRTGIDN
jgi:hypothetical protein